MGFSGYIGSPIFLLPVNKTHLSSHWARLVIRIRYGKVVNSDSRRPATGNQGSWPSPSDVQREFTSGVNHESS